MFSGTKFNRSQARTLFEAQLLSIWSLLNHMALKTQPKDKNNKDKLISDFDSECLTENKKTDEDQKSLSNSSWKGSSTLLKIHFGIEPEFPPDLTSKLDQPTWISLKIRLALAALKYANKVHIF